MTLAITDDELTTGLQLLEAGIPLTLLLDLASGPQSHDLYDSEPGEADWLEAHRLAG